MGGAASRLWKNTKKIGKDAYEGIDKVTGADALAGEAKKGWDNARGATKKKEEKAEAARIAAIPEAEQTQGMADTNSLLKRKGTKSTQKVGRSRLGGRSLLGE